MKLDKETVLNDLKNFISEYQKSLWSSNTIKYDHIIPIITVNDLIYKFGYDCSLKQFKDFVANEPDISFMLNDFIANNYVHYCSSVKLKELLQEYKESNVMLEPNTFEFDISSITTYNDIGVKLNNQISINSGLKSDLDDETTSKIIKDVDKFNDY